jgi:tRNA G18 (ribose-2'-O)-methylase SpoU
MRIDSPTNPRIQAALRAVEDGERLLLEGHRAIGEALASGIVPKEIFLEGEETGGMGHGPAVELAAERGAAVYSVSSKVLRKLSDLPSERGVVALAIPPRLSLQDLHPSKKPPSVSLFLLLDGVQDPANVGAIVRSAEAFGAGGVLLTRACASPFSPKALRASALSALRVPIATHVTAEDAVAWSDRHGATLAGAAARGGDSPSALAAIRPLVLVIGSEGQGISPALEARLACRVTIPLAEPVESLNAAVAAGLFLFIATRPPA